MKFICSKTNLLKGINHVQKAISTKTTLPILEGIYLKTYDNEIKLTGNDLEIGIEVLVSADIITDGEVVINSKLFGDVVRKLPDYDIEIELKNNKLNIKCEKSFFELTALPSDGFPSLPEVEDMSSFNIDAKDFREILKRTVIAVSVDDNRPILTGSLFEIKDNKLYVVSIDGFRLALRNSSVKSENDISIVVPGKSINELIKIIDDEDGEIAVIFSENYIMFKTDDKKMVSRLLDGEFPNYKSIIPTDSETEIKVNRRDLLNSVERASLISNDNKLYPVKLNIDEDKIEITLESDKASVDEEVEAEIDGEPVEIGFNCRYIIEALRAIEDDEIIITFRGSTGPCVIKPIEKDNFIYLVVPVRIKNSY